MPDATLRAFYEHGEVGEPMPADGGDCDASWPGSPPPASTSHALGAQLQTDGAAAFVARGRTSLSRIDEQARR